MSAPGPGRRWESPEDSRVAPRVGPACLLVVAAIAPLLGIETLAGQAARLVEVHRMAATEHSLSVVAVVAASPDGTIWVSQPQDGNVVALRPGAHRLERLGSRGEGPGTFREVSRLSATNSELWVFDRTLRRGTRFGPDGKVVSIVSMQTPNNLSGAWPLVAGPGGTAWWRVLAPVRGIHAANLDGSGARRTDEYPVPACSVVARDGTTMRSVTVPFCHHDLADFSPDAGYRVVASPLRRGLNSAGVRLVVMRWSGDTTLDRTVWFSASPISAPVRDSVIADFRTRAQRAHRSLVPVLMEALERPDLVREYPPVVDVDVSSQGEVILTTRRGPTGKRAYYFNGPHDAPVEFSLAPSQDIRWVGGQRLLIVEADEDGLQDVVLYALETGRGNRPSDRQ